MPYRVDPAPTRLRTIADRLGMPIEHFFIDEPWLRSHSRNEECVRLCHLVDTDDGLSRVCDGIPDIRGAEQQ